jgi:hypothetical protein
MRRNSQGLRPWWWLRLLLLLLLLLLPWLTHGRVVCAKGRRPSSCGNGSIHPWWLGGLSMQLNSTCDGERSAWIRRHAIISPPFTASSSWLRRIW